MMHFKNNNKKAFTLIELLVALLIAATVLIPLLVLQGSTFKGVGHFSQALKHMLHANNVLVSQHMEIAIQGDAPKKMTQQSTMTDATMTYERKKVSSNSALKNIKNLQQEVVTVDWQDIFGKQKETLINFIYKPEPKKQ